MIFDQFHGALSICNAADFEAGSFQIFFQEPREHPVMICDKNMRLILSHVSNPKLVLAPYASRREFAARHAVPDRHFIYRPAGSCVVPEKGGALYG